MPKSATYRLWPLDAYVLVNGRKAYLDNGRLPYKPAEISRALAARMVSAHRFWAPQGSGK